MYPVNLTQDPQMVDEMQVSTTWPLAVFLEPDLLLCNLLADLSPDKPWDVRKVAAQRLGDHRSPRALQGLLAHLPTDPFWMVRCAIIQALERIGDPNAIPTLLDVAKKDGFQVVRSYAAKAIERLSS
jgi:HEAT repeat protein